MNLKEFVHSFNIEKPDWSLIPEKFPDCDLRDLTSAEIGLYNSAVTVWQLAHPPSLKLRGTSPSTRAWVSPEGYQFLGVWQNAALLRTLIRKFTLKLTLNHPYERRLKAQLDDAARSVVRNIEEGFKRPTTREYLEFLGFSQASLEEVKGDIRDAKTDGFLPSQPGSSLAGTLNIDLRVFKGTLKGQAKGDPASNPHHPYYLPLTTLNPKSLTFEIFMELINKTDYLLRALVESLEKGRPK